MVADNIDGLKHQQQHQANSVTEQHISDITATVSELQDDDKVLMKNQEEMASITMEEMIKP